MSTEKRAPLFKLEDVKCAMKTQGRSCSDEDARKALHFIDAKIASGELMVVKWVKVIQPDELVSMWFCSECNWRNAPFHYAFCPGCGNPIAK